MQVIDREHLLREFVDFTCWLGLKTVSATAVLDRPEVRPQFVGVHNIPTTYVDSFNCLVAARRDPVMHCRTDATCSLASIRSSAPGGARPPRETHWQSPADSCSTCRTELCGSPHRRRPAVRIVIAHHARTGGAFLDHGRGRPPGRSAVSLASANRQQLAIWTTRRTSWSASTSIKPLSKHCGLG
jgi:hypothetical protein